MMETLVDLLEDAALRYGEQPALSTHRGLRARRWSYQDLWRSAVAVANHLRCDLGLTPGTRVVVWAPNSPELVATYLGVMLGRLVLVPIDPTATPSFVACVATTTRAELIVSAFAVPDAISARSVAMADLPMNQSDSPPDDRPSSDDVAEIVFTSGTTGTPKGVMLTHGNIVANVESALRLVPRRPLRLVSLLPLSHMLEQTVGLYGPLVLGSTIAYPTSRRVPVLMRAMRRSAVTTIVLVPQVLELMAHGIEREVTRQGKVAVWRWAHRLATRVPMPLRRTLFRRVHQGLGGHLDFVICGGAALSADVAGQWERMGVRVIEGYGTTECAPIVTGNTYWDRRPGTVGRPVPVVQVRLSPAGEVVVKGPNVTAGYWEDPEGTTKAFDHYGWYRTGDLGAWDNGGRLRITGRLADRIVLSSGLNVYPEDVEDALRGEPEIEDCVVVALPDRSGNPAVHAAIIPGAGAEATAADAVRRAAAKLAEHQRPTGFTMWPQEDFPRTNLLKVKRHEVVAALRTTAGVVPPPPHVATVSGDETLERVRAMLVGLGHVDAAAITRESDLTMDIGLDSLGRVELAVRLEDELGLDVEDGQLAELGTVGALCALVEHSERPATPAVAGWPRRPVARAARALVQRGLVFPIHRLVAHPFAVRGRAHLDGVAGPVLLIANHASHLDTPSILRALPRSLRRRTAVAAAADYFYRYRWLGAVATVALGTFPFSREGAVRSSLEHCGDLIDDGWSVLIYPEGTRSTSGVRASFRSGIGFLAAELDVPVIPIGVSGAHALWPKGARFPHRGSITVRFGPPIRVPVDADRDELITKLEQAVASLAATQVDQPPVATRR